MSDGIKVAIMLGIIGIAWFYKNKVEVEIGKRHAEQVVKDLFTFDEDGKIVPKNVG